MKTMLPEILMRNSTESSASERKKKQGGIFELHLDRGKSNLMNETYTAGFGDRHYKTSLNKKILNDTERQFRTLRLRDSQYDVPRERRLLTSHMSLYKSARISSFSVDKNPETSTTLQSKNEVDNATTLYNNRIKELHELQFKITPFSFVSTEFKEELLRIEHKITTEIHEIQKEFKESIASLRDQMNLLRKETSNEIKVNKVDLNKYEEELKMFQEVADEFPEKMDSLSKEI